MNLPNSEVEGVGVGLFGVVRPIRDVEYVEDGVCTFASERDWLGAGADEDEFDLVGDLTRSLDTFITQLPGRFPAQILPGHRCCRLVERVKLARDLEDDIHASEAIRMSIGWVLGPERSGARQAPKRPRIDQDHRQEGEHGLACVAPLGLSGFLVHDRGLGTGVGSLPAGEINAHLAPLLLLVRRVRDVNLEFARSPLFGNATGSAQEILQAEEQLRILEKNVHAAMRSPEWPQRGRFSQFQQRVCDVKLLPGLRPSKTKALATQRQLGWLPPEQPSDDGP